jgi:addiction module HigA family antidote
MLPEQKPAHPGEVLKELYLDDMGITQVDLAKRIGCHVQKINEIINGRRGISADFAIDLAQVLGTSIEMWLNLQMKYDLWMAMQKKHKKAS